MLKVNLSQGFLMHQPNGRVLKLLQYDLVTKLIWNSDFYMKTYFNLVLLEGPWSRAKPFAQVILDGLISTLNLNNIAVD